MSHEKRVICDGVPVMSDSRRDDTRKAPDSKDGSIPTLLPIHLIFHECEGYPQMASTWISAKRRFYF